MILCKTFSTISMTDVVGKIVLELTIRQTINY